MLTKSKQCKTALNNYVNVQITPREFEFDGISYCLISPSHTITANASLKTKCRPEVKAFAEWCLEFYGLISLVD